jgi:hypothetical protein
VATAQDRSDVGDVKNASKNFKLRALKRSTHSCARRRWCSIKRLLHAPTKAASSAPVCQMTTDT